MRFFFYSHFIFLLFLTSVTSAQVIQTFTYTGSPQSFTVPSCVTILTVNISGANGGDGSNNSVGPGGAGGSVTAVISVSPGQVLNLYIGGSGGNGNSFSGGIGGYNGGGFGAFHPSGYSGGGGGGASDIRVSPYTLADRIIIAGGGGGGGTYTNTTNSYERGGNGGGVSGENGYSGNSNGGGVGGNGGTANTGGTGGFIASFCSAYSGSLGLGGAANTCSSGGGGGGGGYYGGGGGLFAGGGGGSSFAVSTASYVSHVQGASSGSGSISISYFPSFSPSITLSSGNASVCSGSSLNLAVTPSLGITGYTWGTNSNATNLTVTPTINTTYSVIVNNGFCNANLSVPIAIKPNPTINIVASMTACCPGSAVSLTATGGQGVNYTWTSVPANGTIVGQDEIFPSFPAPGAYVFTATGDNSYNCVSSNSITVLVSAPPVINVVATKSLICAGGSTTLNATGAALYQWDMSVGFTSTASTIVSPTLTTTYNITGLNSGACTGSVNVTVYVYKPAISVLGNTNVCFGQVSTLTANIINSPSSAVNSFTWEGPGLTGQWSPTISISPTVQSIYTISVKSPTAGNQICYNSKTISLNYLISPTVVATASKTYICRGELFDLHASGAISYTWNNNAYGDTITASHYFIGTAAYTLSGSFSNGCIDDTVIFVKISECTGLKEIEQNYVVINVYPNPNNGRFSITCDQDLKLKLMNELGQVVREFELDVNSEYKVQVADLAKGIYFISGSNNQAVTRQKIIVR